MDVTLLQITMTLKMKVELAQTFLTTRFQKINNMGQKVKRFPAITFSRGLPRPSPVLTEIPFIFTIQVKMPPTRSTSFKWMWRYCEDISGRIVSLPVNDVITNKPFSYVSPFSTWIWRRFTVKVYEPLKQHIFHVTLTLSHFVIVT